MLNRRFIMYFRMYKVIIIVVFLIVLLIVASVIGLRSLESFYRKMTLATMPLQFLMAGIHAAIFVFMYLVFLRGGFAKLDKAPIKGRDIDVRWKDVIGMEGAKQEAWEVVQLIRDRSRLKAIGGKVIKGLLLIGPPGCGKTYLAKAIATEAHLPFISMSGSEFVEIFVGVGASRVRKLFKKARNLAYGYGGCIIFLDEIDSVGRSRAFSYFGGGQETSATQNQLLAELDGLKEKGHNIVVIAATNAPEESLDPALKRPGRFDRMIYVTLPNLEDREKIFRYYLSKVSVEEGLDVGRLARRAVKKSPADIENLVKESALITTRGKKTKISWDEISEAFERIELGIKHPLTMTPKEKEMTAYHESGHLVTTYLLHPTEDVFKASIIPRRATLGVVYAPPKEELYTRSKDMLLADIKVSLSGYVAEKLKVGVTSTGVAGDFRQAMKVAHTMVWKWGMGDSGFLGDYTQIPSGGGVGASAENQLSEEVKAALNRDTNKIFQKCVKEVEDLLTKERKILDRFAKELLAKEELEYDEIEAIFKEFEKKPPKKEN
ncbi:MAG: AAA family ATPase [Candidatus Omnitrophica bacterium]|nr:AAA family ATPase [Candidatus Omnitrophota bacterium]